VELKWAHIVARYFQSRRTETEISTVYGNNLAPV
jgi:hypothetical protein